MNRKCVAMYVRRTLQEKTEFLKEHQVWLGHLSISLW